MKFYNYEFLLYLDTESYDFIEVMNKIKSTCNYAFILHDKDKDDGGKNMKAHYHFLAFFPTQHSKSALVKKFGVPENFINVIDNKIGAIQYLIHKNDPNKYQYDFNNINTNFDISKYFDNKIDNENQIIYDIINYIKSSDYIYYNVFYDFILANNYWSYYRRSAFPINKLIEEHNNYYTKMTM